MILTKNEIDNKNLFSFGMSRECLRPTSYNLRLGDEYLLINNDENENTQIQTQSCEKNGFLTIPAFGSAIISTYEKLNLPLDIAGRFDLKIKHALEGIIVQMGVQVEPGYKGPLFALVHNISSKEKTFKYNNNKESIFAIEFHKMSMPAEKGASEITSLQKLLPSYVIRGGLHSMIEEYKSSKKDLEKYARDLQVAHASILQLSTQIESRKNNFFYGFVLFIVSLTMSIALPVSIAKLTYDKDDIPFTTAKALSDDTSANIDYDYLAYQIKNKISAENNSHIDKGELSEMIKTIIHEEMSKAEQNKPGPKVNKNGK